MKRFVGYVIDKAVKAIPRKKKVSPDIKSVKKFTEKSADQFAGTKSKTSQERANIVRRRESIKRMNKLEGLQNKRKEGIKASKEVKKMVDTGKAKLIGGTPFHKGVREKKMGGGMMGRRMGYSEGSSKGKIPTTPKEKSLAKLAPPKDRITFGDVVAGRTKSKRMQARDGTAPPMRGRKNIQDPQFTKKPKPTGTRSGGTRPRPGSLLDPNNPIIIKKKEFKKQFRKDAK
jgi:hypothetical protein